MVLCKDAVTGANLTVIPSSVEEGDIFTVLSNVANGTIPDSIDCIYLDGGKTKIQQNIIETSGDVSLNLKEKFGAFTLMSCDSGSIGGSGVKTCLETLSYVVDISNVGPVELEIKDLDLTIGNEGTTTFLNELDNPVLGPGDLIVLEVLLFLDRCVAKEICAEVKVEAIPTNGNSRQCQDVDKYCLQTDPVPVPVPIYLPVPPPVKVPTAVPVKQPIVAPLVAPVPIPVPVPSPVYAPVAPPLSAPIPVSIPVPQYAVPTLPTTPVKAPKSKLGMSKLPTSPTIISPSNPSKCAKAKKGTCSKGI
jgi:hypothetical protein